MTQPNTSDFESIYSQFIDGFTELSYQEQQAILSALSTLSEARKNR